MTEHHPGLLLVDDDPNIRESLSLYLDGDFSVHTANSRAQAMEVLSSVTKPLHLALVDLGLPPMAHTPEEGFALLRDLRVRQPWMRILVLSGRFNRATLHHAILLGAVDFVAKPVVFSMLRNRLDHHFMLTQIEEDQTEPRLPTLIGESAAIKSLRDQMPALAKAMTPLLIEGEIGAGKALFARYLHRLGSPQGDPFVLIRCRDVDNCCFLPFLEVHIKEGKFRGSIFFEEVGGLPLSAQKCLLEYLENAVMSHCQIEATMRYRILTSNQRPLQHEVAEGRLLSRLAMHLLGLHVVMPPLRERGDDRWLLLQHYQNGNVSLSRPPFYFSQGARDIWMRYDFPGNLMELRYLVERLHHAYAGQQVSSQQLTEMILQQGLGSSEQVLQRLEEGCFNLPLHLLQIERNYISLALEKSAGNHHRAAVLLGVTAADLSLRLERLEVKKQDVS